MTSISEILRKLADMFDSENNPSTLSPVEATPAEQDKEEIMLYPLQQKLELLKKAVGVDNAFDTEEEPQEEPTCGCGGSDEYSDEMAIMKKNAGIAPIAATMVASEDDLLG